MSKINIPNGTAFSFGGEGSKDGTVYFTIDPCRETTEYGRNLAVFPKAHHPQMESIITLKASGDAVMSLACCGFSQLATMRQVPEDVADQFDITQWGFRNSCLVNVSAKILGGLPPDGEVPVLSNGSIEILQQFLILYAGAVWRIDTPLVIMINANAVQDEDYNGDTWYTFAVACIMSVSQEEWEKLYDLKKLELDWATTVLDNAILKARIGASLAIDKSKGGH